MVHFSNHDKAKGINAEGVCISGTQSDTLPFAYSSSGVRLSEIASGALLFTAYEGGTFYRCV